MQYEHCFWVLSRDESLKQRASSLPSGLVVSWGAKAAINTTKDKRRNRRDYHVPTGPPTCYFLTAPPTINDFTTIPLGCMPTGIIVSSEYSVGSSLRAVRF
jgi:hypothetical protein